MELPTGVGDGVGGRGGTQDPGGVREQEAVTGTLAGWCEPPPPTRAKPASVIACHTSCCPGGLRFLVSLFFSPAPLVGDGARGGGVAGS